MLTAIRTRLDKDQEDGFTLIELMVVVLIIGILIAIAIPTFLGAQDRARDRGAQSDLRNSVTAAKTIATDSAGKMTDVSVTSLQAAEGALTFVAGAPTVDSTDVGLFKSTNAADAILVSRHSASGTWFGMATSRTGDVGYCRGTSAEVNVAPSVGADGNLTTHCIADSW